MRLEDHEVDAALTSLKAQGLLRYVHPSHGRSVTRYRQVADESWGLSPAAAALVAVLMLRGPADGRRAEVADRNGCTSSSTPRQWKPSCVNCRPSARCSYWSVSPARRRRGGSSCWPKRPSPRSLLSLRLQRWAGMAHRVAQLEACVVRLEPPWLTCCPRPLRTSLRTPDEPLMA